MVLDFVYSSFLFPRFAIAGGQQPRRIGRHKHQVLGRFEHQGQDRGPRAPHRSWGRREKAIHHPQLNVRVDVVVVVVVVVVVLVLVLVLVL